MAKPEFFQQQKCFIGANDKWPCAEFCVVYIIWHLLKVLSPFWHCVAGDTTSHQLPTRIGTSGEHEKSWCDPHSMAKHDATIDNIFAG